MYHGYNASFRHEIKKSGSSVKNNFETLFVSMFNRYLASMIVQNYLSTESTQIRSVQKVTNVSSNVSKNCFVANGMGSQVESQIQS